VKLSSLILWLETGILFQLLKIDEYGVLSKALSGREELNCLDTSLSQCLFTHHKSNMDYPVNKPRYPWSDTGNLRYERPKEIWLFTIWVHRGEWMQWHSLKRLVLSRWNGFPKFWRLSLSSLSGTDVMYDTSAHQSLIIEMMNVSKALEIYSILV
jgi:hypothetical protein